MFHDTSLSERHSTRSPGDQSTQDKPAIVKVSKKSKGNEAIPDRSPVVRCVHHALQPQTIGPIQRVLGQLVPSPPHMYQLRGAAIKFIPPPPRLSKPFARDSIRTIQLGPCQLEPLQWLHTAT